MLTKVWNGFSLFFLTFMFFICCSGMVSGQICGDADVNGMVDINDSLTIMKYDVGLLFEFEYPLRVEEADLNGDMKLNSFDALKIAMFIEGLTPYLCESETPFNTTGGETYWTDETGTRLASDELNLNVGDTKLILLAAEVPIGKLLKAFKFTVKYDETICEIVDTVLPSYSTFTAFVNSSDGMIIFNGFDKQGVFFTPLFLIEITVKGLKAGAFNFDITVDDFGSAISDQFKPTPYPLLIKVSDSGLYTQAQVDEIVNNILSLGDIDGDKKISLTEVIQILQEKSNLCDSALSDRLKPKSSSILAKDSDSGLYTQAQVDETVRNLLLWGDIDGDKKIGLTEAIHALQVTSDLRTSK